MSCEILQHFTVYRRDLLTKIFCFQIDNFAERQNFSFHEEMKSSVCEEGVNSERCVCVCTWEHTFPMHHLGVLWEQIFKGARKTFTKLL